MAGLPNLPQDFATEWKRVQELALAAFTAANADKILVGKVEVFAGPAVNVPDGWLVCDGSAVSRADFADLFGQIGTTWGAGDGSTTFNVPDLVDRTLVGAGNLYALGEMAGSASHSHTNPSTNNAGGHQHPIVDTDSAGGHQHPIVDTDSAGGHSHTNPSTGSAGSHGHNVPASTSSISVGPGGLGAANASHTHNASSAGGHSHSVGSTGSDGGHVHSVPDTLSRGSHVHSVPDTLSRGDHGHSQGDTGSSSNVPPYAAVLPIIRY